MTNDRHEFRNKLTEYLSGFQMTSKNISLCYLGIHPAQLHKTVQAILNTLLFNKQYNRPGSYGYDKIEDKRIFTNCPVSLIDIAKSIHPKKYNSDEEIENDVSNISKRIVEIDENNIFFYWKCGYPYNYMFFMERDIGCWKYYNKKGCVIPKTINKIINLHSPIINSMKCMLNQIGQNVSQYDVEKSFGDFINRMYKKMNPNVSVKIPKWENTEGIEEYIGRIKPIIESMEPYEGLEEDEDFSHSLPQSVRDYLLTSKEDKDKKEKTMSIEVLSDLEKELVGADQNIRKIEVKKKKIARPLKTKIPVFTAESLMPIQTTFKGIDAFKNCNDFINFYRSQLEAIDRNVEFHQDYSFDRASAMEVLDILINNKRNGDYNFLKAWIRNFHFMTLKGDNVKNKEKTSIKNFKNSFATFNAKYVG